MFNIMKIAFFADYGILVVPSLNPKERPRIDSGSLPPLKTDKKDTNDGNLGTKKNQKGALNPFFCFGLQTYIVLEDIFYFVLPFLGFFVFV